MPYTLSSWCEKVALEARLHAIEMQLLIHADNEMSGENRSRIESWARFGLAASLNMHSHRTLTVWYLPASVTKLRLRTSAQTVAKLALSLDNPLSRVPRRRKKTVTSWSKVSSASNTLTMDVISLFVDADDLPAVAVPMTEDTSYTAVPGKPTAVDVDALITESIVQV